MPGRHVPTSTAASSSPQDERTTPQNPISSFNHSNALPDPTLANTRPLTLTCPVPCCSLAFDKKTPHGYLWRHLRNPGVYRRTGEEKAAWLHLHKIEFDRLAATDITPAQRKREANRMRARKVREQKALKAARFELRARNMGIREKELAAQKVAIREGMHAAKQRGDSIGFNALTMIVLLLAIA
ncbi:hypothetical protein C7212DRAFT_346978 [Tuber magnatum]|uniref:Uncharacterized protein n=1 Tax=Tuber magnatum TaxID=42249 RepID=A0A317SGB5_9PEZI|nr:hypothetical protein C7212DRAFT_346978 [Tuber magnatum]